MCTLQKKVDLVKRVFVWRSIKEFHFHRSEACFQKVISDLELKSMLCVVKMQQNVIKDYWKLVAKVLYPCKTVARRVKRFRSDRNETADLRRSGRHSCIRANCRR
ncbi:hypothetical protein TNCV_1161501 [Trichonephila clavipes]|nr:hypothetical protein TNCV_1161501 [Trichonephila clavipes]